MVAVDAKISMTFWGSTQNGGTIFTFLLLTDLQGAIQKFQYVSNCALSSGAICLKILPFDCLSLCHVVL